MTPPNRFDDMFSSTVANQKAPNSYGPQETVPLVYKTVCNPVAWLGERTFSKKKKKGRTRRKVSVSG